MDTTKFGAARKMNGYCIGTADPSRSEDPPTLRSFARCQSESLLAATDQPATVDSAALRRGSVMEKVANVFSGLNSQSCSTLHSATSTISNQSVGRSTSRKCQLKSGSVSPTPLRKETSTFGGGGGGCAVASGGGLVTSAKSVASKREKPPVPPRDKSTTCKPRMGLSSSGALSSRCLPAADSSASVQSLICSLESQRLCDNSAGKKAARDKPTPPEKPSRFAFIRNAGHSLVGSGAVGIPRSPRVWRRKQDAVSANTVRTHSAAAAAMANVVYTNWTTLWLDGAFLDRFFQLGLSSATRLSNVQVVNRESLGNEQEEEEDETLAVCRWSQVCRKWRYVLYRLPEYWKNLVPAIDCQFIRQHSADDSRDQQQLLSYLHSLQMRLCDSLRLLNADDQDLLCLPQAFPAATKCLHSLRLHTGRFSDSALHQVLSQLHSIRHLELNGCNELTDSALWTSLTPRVQTLTVGDCINIADESVAAIAQNLSTLEELNLQAYHVTDAAICHFADKPSSACRVVRLTHCWELTNNAALHIANCFASLRVLSLSGCSKITDEGVEAIAENLRGLQSLDLSWCVRLTDVSLEVILCDLTQLQSLNLDRCVHITDVGVGYLSRMSSLCHLNIRWCIQLDDMALVHICSMSQLISLSIAGCSRISADALCNLVQLRNLRQLEITNCSAGSVQLVEYVRQNLPRCRVYY